MLTQKDRQKNSNNPLISSKPDEWRDQAKWALSNLFFSNNILPVTTVVRKDRGSNDIFQDIRDDGVKILNKDLLWFGVVGQFATFLKQHNAKGEIWFDQLGSRKEEARWQESWARMRNEPWPAYIENQKTLKRIAAQLKFFDSVDEPLIQVADFISGVLWAASEGDEEFLLRVFREYFPWGKDTYTFMFFV